MNKKWGFDKFIPLVICKSCIFSATSTQGEPVIDSQRGKMAEGLISGKVMTRERIGVFSCI